MADLKTRKFNGRKYDSFGRYYTKANALKGKRVAQNKGYSTRIIKSKGYGKSKFVYRLYIRK